MNKDNFSGQVKELNANTPAETTLDISNFSPSVYGLTVGVGGQTVAGTLTASGLAGLTSAAVQFAQVSAATYAGNVNFTHVASFTNSPVLSAGLTMADATDIAINATTGTKIGTAITQKMGFYNATPIVQRAGAAQAAVVTTATTQTTPFGFATQAQGDAIVALVNELRAWAVAQGFIKGAA